jgi:hypothetical protein
MQIQYANDGEQCAWPPCPRCSRERRVKPDGAMVAHDAYNPTAGLMAPFRGPGEPHDLLGDAGT